MIVEVGSFGKSIEELIELKMKATTYPTCIGRMGLPIVYNKMKVPGECVKPIVKVVKAKRIVEELKGVIDPSSTAIDIAAYCIDDEGYDYIENTKDQLAQKYVDRVCACMLCTYFERCDKLTQHYLKKVELDLIS